MDRLFIHLTSGSWSHYRDMECIAEGEDWQALPQPATGETIIFVPGEDVLLTQVRVEPKQRRQLRNILPYLAEEQLAEDVGTLHFTLGPEMADGIMPVAIVRQSLLAEWLEKLTHVGVVPTVLLPETLAIPYEPGRWALLANSGKGSLRTGEASGVTAEYDALAEICATLVETMPAAEALDCYLPQDTQNMQSWLEQLRSRVPLLSIGIEHASSTAFEIMCSHCLDMQAWTINLLPDEQRHRSSHLAWNLGKIAAACAALMLAVNVGIAIYLNYRTDAIRADETALYHDLFPQETTVVDPAQQMRGHITQGNAGSNERGFLSLLGKMAAVTGPDGTTGVTMQHIGYTTDSHALALQVEAPGLDNINRLVKQLNGAGVHANIASMTNGKDSTKAEISVGEGAR